MRYTLDTNNQLRQVVIVDMPDGSKLVHPSDDIIDELGAGYRLVNTRPPKYDEETQTISFTYGMKKNTIIKVWEVTDKATGD